MCRPRRKCQGIWRNILRSEGSPSRYDFDPHSFEIPTIDVPKGIVHIIGPEQGFTVCHESWIHLSRCLNSAILVVARHHLRLWGLAYFEYESVQYRSELVLTINFSPRSFRFSRVRDWNLGSRACSCNSDPAPKKGEEYAYYC